MRNNQHVLIIGFVWPEPDSSAAGQRMMQLISLFQSQDWIVTFASSAAESKHMANLAQLGIDTISIDINDSDFDAFIQKIRPSIVLFDRFVTEEQFGWRIAKQCPQALRILDTEDLHCLRKARQKAVKEGRVFKNEDLLTEETSKREIASILRSDLSLVISEVEMTLLEDFFEIDSGLMHYLPLMTKPVDEPIINDWLKYEERNHFVTVGNFSHDPNLDAVLFLKNKIWPLIRRELPEAELHIYGAYPTQKVNALHQPEEGFYIEGRVDDAEKVVKRARVCLAPLRFGVGLKGKLIEAMLCGTPSITTSIGSEGINGDLAWNGIIANEAEDIALGAVKLYKNENKWTKSQKQGIRIINNRLARRSFGQEFVELVLNIQKELEKHRRKNFVGAMLRHHTMASTEYMSRWIEEKNKK